MNIPQKILVTFFVCLLIGIAILAAISDDHKQKPPKQVAGLYEATQWTDGKDTVLIYELDNDTAKLYVLTDDAEQLFKTESIENFKKRFRQIE